MPAVFIILVITLWLFPPITYALALQVKREQPQAFARTVLAAIFMLLILMAFARFHLSLSNAYAKLIAQAAGYFAWCYLAACHWKISRKSLRIPYMLATCTPIALGYIVGSVGIFGLYLASGDIARPPQSVVAMPGNRTCEFNRWGFAGDQGSDRVLYQHWDYLPFLRHEIATNRAYNGADADAVTCDDLQAMADGKAAR